MKYNFLINFKWDVLTSSITVQKPLELEVSTATKSGLKPRNVKASVFIMEIEKGYYWTLSFNLDT